MQAAKKQIVKEDGRQLVYYHFPQSASPEQSEAFAAVAAPSEPLKKAAEGSPRV